MHSLTTRSAGTAFSGTPNAHRASSDCCRVPAPVHVHSTTRCTSEPVVPVIGIPQRATRAHSHTQQQCVSVYCQYLTLVGAWCLSWCDSSLPPPCTRVCSALSRSRSRALSLSLSLSLAASFLFPVWHVALFRAYRETTAAWHKLALGLNREVAVCEYARGITVPSRTI